jgi:hypothetical protein
MRHQVLPIIGKNEHDWTMPRKNEGKQILLDNICRSAHIFYFFGSQFEKL